MQRAMTGLALAGLAVSAALQAAAGAAHAEGTVKVGLICPFSGQFSDTAAQIENGIRLYMKEHGDTVAGKKIELIRKDTGGIAPDVAKRLAQELVVRDQVDMFGCFALTPNALAVADVSAQAKKFMVDMNAATSIVTTKSPYMVRTSFTIAMVNEALGSWAYKSGIRTAYTLVSDFSAGHDGEAAFQKAFTDAGGKIIGSARYPILNQDFTAFLQRAKDLAPDAIYIWSPGGTQPAAIGKAIAERGIDKEKTKILGQGELTLDEALKGMGDSGLGIITAFHYDPNHQSALNKKFVAEFNADYNRNPDMFAVGGYDGAHLIYEVLKKTNGDTDAEKLIAAAKGMAWESPRGPMSIDPETRDAIENVYIRRVERVDGVLRNVEFDKIENVKDPIKERTKK
jgi:branched-chain amino acid transport system substrate-binding protein